MSKGIEIKFPKDWIEYRDSRCQIPISDISVIVGSPPDQFSWKRFSRQQTPATSKRDFPPPKLLRAAPNEDENWLRVITPALKINSKLRTGHSSEKKSAFRSRFFSAIEEASSHLSQQGNKLSRIQDRVLSSSVPSSFCFFPLDEDLQREDPDWSKIVNNKA